MSEQAVAAIREMLQPGTILEVTASDIAEVPVGRRQIVVSREPNGIMTEITGPLPPEVTERKSFIPVGGGCGPTDAEQLLVGNFVVWHQSFPDASRITYQIVDTIYQAIVEGPDHLWSVVGQGEDFSHLAGEVFDLVTAPGGLVKYLDWQILPISHVQAHPEKYPLLPS